MSDSFYTDIRNTIDEYGQNVMCIAGDMQNAFPFAYTIGNHEIGMPDLIIVKFGSPEQMCVILNEIRAKVLLKKDIVLADGLYDIEFNFPLKLRRCNNQEYVKTNYTVQAGQFYESEDYDVWQVLIPDRDGKFPGDDGFDKKYEVDIL